MKHTWKYASAFLAAILLTVGTAAPVVAGWQQNASRQWCYQEKDGRRFTGWKFLQKSWYCFNDAGIMQTGWVKNGGSWYYCHQNGTMATSWQQVDGKWYNLRSDGAMRTGWFCENQKWYYLSTSGAMKTGWIEQNGKHYYLDTNGVMATGEQTIEGKECVFDSTGALQEKADIAVGEASAIFADRILVLVNAERKKEGVPLLVPSGSLNSAAVIRAKEVGQVCSHTRPDGRDWETVFAEVNQTTNGVGENIAQGYLTPEDVVTAWMDSAGHRKNILDSRFNYMGLGTYLDEKGVLSWAQLFAMSLK